MDITIKIECDTIQEFYAHLGALRDQILKQTKKLQLDIELGEFPEDVDLNDTNCYGTHEVKIVNPQIRTMRIVESPGKTTFVFNDPRIK